MTLLRSVTRPAALAGAAALAAAALAAPAAATTGPAPEEPTGAVAASEGTAARGFLDVRPIDELDLERYQGRWLQLATIPADFAAACERDTQAEYTLLPDGLVQVVNSCVAAGGAPIVIEGRARVVGPDSNAQLQVTFARDADGEFVFGNTGGDYWVIGLDEHDYEWAVVGGPDRTGGFVLSRDPRLSAREIVQVVVTLVRNGYNPCDFEITATTGGIEENRSLCHL